MSSIVLRVKYSLLALIILGEAVTIVAWIVKIRIPAVIALWFRLAPSEVFAIIFLIACADIAGTILLN